MAAAIALFYPAAPMGRGAEDKGRMSAEAADISERRSRQARQIKRHSEELLRAMSEGQGRLTSAEAAEARAYDRGHRC
jgi:hypothetical protein